MSIASPKKITFKGRVLLLGCGAVSRCFQPLLLRHFDMDFKKLTIIDFENRADQISQTLAAGAIFVQLRITPENYASILSKYLKADDLLIDFAYNISTLDLINWCYQHNVLYINTAVEEWDPYQDAFRAPASKTLYTRHLQLRESIQKRSYEFGSVTSVVEHGANPGLVSHWVKQALEDIVMAMMKNMDPQSFEALELDHALVNENFPLLAQLTGTKVIHIAERDSQITNVPKKVDEFVNTWSIEGFREEGIAPAEMGWGTHERRLPTFAQVHNSMPGNQICLAQMGINTWVRSWVPSGEITGMVVRHGEAFTISDYLTVWNTDDSPEYRPTVHYAYMPCDAALVSLHEMKMRNYTLQNNLRILGSDIVDGMDELGVLLLGHKLNGWWTGSLLDIHETRKLVGSDYNATTLQVAASVLGALFWMIKNPRNGFNVPDDLPYREVLEVANPYLGPSVSKQTDWNPLKNRFEPFAKYGKTVSMDEDDMWQFQSFLV